MQALYYEPGRAPEMIDAGSFEEKLGGETEVLWPFKELDVCLVMLCDRERQEPNRVLFGRTICGPFFIAGYKDDFNDLSESDAAAVEGFFYFAEERYRKRSFDPLEEDASEEEYSGHIRIVDEETFYRMIKEDIR